MVDAAETPAGEVVIRSYRTQTKIKNYFYGNIRYFLKIIIKHFHKKSTGFVNDIKTETLLELYEAKNSTFPITEISKTTRSYPRPSNNSNTALIGIIAKKLSGSVRRSFVGWLNCSSPTISKRTTPPKEKNRNHRKKATANR